MADHTLVFFCRVSTRFCQAVATPNPDGPRNGDPALQPERAAEMLGTHPDNTSAPVPELPQQVAQSGPLNLEIHCPTALGTGSPCGQLGESAHASPPAWWLAAIPGGPWLVDASPQLCPGLHLASCRHAPCAVCPCPPLHKDTSMLDTGPRDCTLTPSPP